MWLWTNAFQFVWNIFAFIMSNMLNRFDSGWHRGESGIEKNGEKLLLLTIPGDFQIKNEHQMNYIKRQWHRHITPANEHTHTRTQTHSLSRWMETNCFQSIDLRSIKSNKMPATWPYSPFGYVQRMNLKHDSEWCKMFLSRLQSSEIQCIQLPGHKKTLQAVFLRLSSSCSLRLCVCLYIGWLATATAITSSWCDK